MAQLTDRQIKAQIDVAIARQQKIDATEPRAKEVLFDDGRLTLHFTNGASFSFLAESVEAIATQPSKILATVELTPSGKGLRWNEPDIDLSIQGLLLGIFGSNMWMKQIAAKGGSSTSEKKRAASRGNGAKGGRPKKNNYTPR
ncbi:MAG: DUF2442 domain-containing protein [Pleurocapsa minor HA4230-MV1]|jgi:hypothetical protein|nr:DUF2442 domain-containing protein [Pleurocapsa minor HA4230-MV1]